MLDVEEGRFSFLVVSEKKNPSMWLGTLTSLDFQRREAGRVG